MAHSGETSKRAVSKSMVSDCGVQKDHCGYCNSAGCTRISHGLWAFDLTVHDYQDLLDRGWRRAGCLLYKPDMENTCCPSYTIRLKASDFVPSKEQDRVLKKMRRFLDGKVELKRTDKMQANMSTRYQSHILPSEADISGSQKQKDELLPEDRCIFFLSDRINDAVNICILRHELPSNIELPKAIVKKVRNQVKKKLIEMSEYLVFSSSISFQIAAVLRHSNLVPSDSSQGHCTEFSPDLIAKMILPYINLSGLLFDFSVKSCGGYLNFYSSLSHFNSIEKLSPKEDNMQHCKVLDVSRYFQNPHEISAQKCRGHELDIRLNQSSFDAEEYALYRKYQIIVHNDEPENVTEESYKRFLVDTPLIFQQGQTSTGKVPHCGFGSFHQQYLMDGRLVAVGVIDILPRCLSSKYLFWDPDFAFLSLGTYSALMEIKWVRDAVACCPTLHYYYLGYYIHSCSKMAYKASYHPSELLCPVRYQWVPFQIAKTLLDRKAYVVLSDFANAQDVEGRALQDAVVVVPDLVSDSEGEDSDECPSDKDEEA